MTALTSNRDTKRMGDDAHPIVFNFPIADNVHIFNGAIVGLNASGRAIPASASAVKIVGVSEGDYDNTVAGHVAGALNVGVRAGTFKLANSAGADALTVADIGETAFLVDDQTVARNSAGTRLVAGTVVKVETSGVWVTIGLQAGNPEAVDIKLVSAADLTAKQYYIVKVDSNGKAALAGAGETAIGVLQNAPNTNELAIIRVFGRSKVVTAATPAAGSAIAADASGKAKAAVLGTVNTSDAGGAADPVVGSHVIGVLLAVGVADTAVNALVLNVGLLPTTAA